MTARGTAEREPAAGVASSDVPRSVGEARECGVARHWGLGSCGSVSPTAFAIGNSKPVMALIINPLQLLTSRGNIWIRGPATAR